MENSEYRKTDHRFPDRVIRFLMGMAARFVLKRLVLGVVVAGVLWGAIR